MARDRSEREVRQVVVRLVLWTAAVLVVLGAPAAGRASPTAPGVLLSGSLRLPAATSFEAPGFHEVLVAHGQVPARVAPAPRYRLTLMLRDRGRPRLRCSTDHPLSGCATVDWADDPSRPKVPAGGVFSNRITIRLGRAIETLYLRRSGLLARVPDAYVPG